MLRWYHVPSWLQPLRVSRHGQSIILRARNLFCFYPWPAAQPIYLCSGPYRDPRSSIMAQLDKRQTGLAYYSFTHSLFRSATQILVTRFTKRVWSSWVPRPFESECPILRKGWRQQIEAKHLSALHSQWEKRDELKDPRGMSPSPVIIDDLGMYCY